MAGKAKAATPATKPEPVKPVDHKTTYEAMRAIMWEMKAIEKSKQSGSDSRYSYKYRGIDDVYNELHGLFAKHGVFTTSVVMDRKDEVVTLNTSSGPRSYHMVIATIQFTFHGPGDHTYMCQTIGEGMDNGDKAAGKAMSYAHKYAMLQTFMAPTADMVDTDYTNYKDAGDPAPQKPATAPAAPKAPAPAPAPAKPVAPKPAPPVPKPAPAPAQPPASAASSAPAPAASPAPAEKNIGPKAKAAMTDTLASHGVKPDWLPLVTGKMAENWTSSDKKPLIALNTMLTDGTPAIQAVSNMGLATFQELGVDQNMLEAEIQVLMPSWTAAQVDQAAQLYVDLLNGTKTVAELQ